MNTKPAVLVLEDNDDVRTILSDLLAANGFRPLGAEKGEVAD